MASAEFHQRIVYNTALLFTKDHVQNDDQEHQDNEDDAETIITSTEVDVDGLMLRLNAHP